MFDVIEVAVAVVKVDPFGVVGVDGPELESEVGVVFREGLEGEAIAVMPVPDGGGCDKLAGGFGHGDSIDLCGLVGFSEDVVVPAGRRGGARRGLSGGQLGVSGESVQHSGSLDVVERCGVVVVGFESSLVPVGQLGGGVKYDGLYNAVSAGRCDGGTQGGVLSCLLNEQSNGASDQRG